MVHIILLYAVFASTFSISKTILGITSPCLLVGIRMTIAGALMLLVQLLRGRDFIKIRKEDLFTALQVSLFSVFICYCCEFWGMRFLPSFKTCTLFSLGPFITYIIACLFFSEEIKLKKWLGLLVGFVGLMPILLTSTRAEDALGTLFTFSWPEAVTLVGVFSYSYGWFMVKKMVQRGYSPMTINGYGMFIGGLCSLGAAFVLERPWVISQPKTFAMLLPMSILIGNFICYNMYAYLLHRYSTTLLSFASVLTPIFAAGYGWLFLNEQITWHFFASMTIVAIGLMIFYHDEFSKQS